MKTIWPAAAAVAVFIGSASGQTVIDGSDAKLPPEVASAAIDAVTQGLRDPHAAEFRKLKLRGSRPGEINQYTVLCGEVNARNGFGGYVGFRPFGYRIQRREAGIYEPVPETSPLYHLNNLAFGGFGCPF